MWWLVLAAAQAGWQVVRDDRVPVSERALWTSDVPDITVDGAGVVWLGFTTRIDDDANHTGGVAHWDGERWVIERDLFSDNIRTLVTTDRDGEVVVFGAGAQTEVLRGGGPWTPLPTIDGTVEEALSATEAWGTVAQHWARFSRQGDDWATTQTQHRDDNTGNQSRITTHGIVLRTYDLGGPWRGYFLFDSTGKETEVFATQDAWDVFTAEVNGQLQVLAQDGAGSYTWRRTPVLRWIETPSGFAQEQVDAFSAAPPSCPLTTDRCDTAARQVLAVGLADGGIPLVVERTGQAAWSRSCLRWAQTASPFPIGSTPRPRSCETYGGWEAQPGRLVADRQRLLVDGDPVSIDRPPVDIEVASALSGDTLHLAWYETDTDTNNVSVRAVALQRVP